MQLQVLCNVHRAAAEWKRDHWNYEPVSVYTTWDGFILFTPVRFV